MRGIITSIKRFAVHDGDGIRTTVFFKGCPMKCVWCHNPETIYPKPQIAFYAHKCCDCGRCVQLCGCHSVENGIHMLNREECTFCGRCVQYCPKDAIEIIGKEMSTEEVFDVLIKDKAFYESCNGGVTLSGGECLMQADFCEQLLRKLKEENINTAVDTCGYVSRNAFDSVIPYTDTFLYDIKAFNEQNHIKCTGKSNKIIMENLKYLDNCGKRTEIRIPFVPGYNEEEIKDIFTFLKNFDNIKKIRILGYHSYAETKYSALEMDNTLPKIMPNKETILYLQKEADKIVFG